MRYNHSKTLVIYYALVVLVYLQLGIVLGPVKIWLVIDLKWSDEHIYGRVNYETVRCINVFYRCPSYNLRFSCFGLGMFNIIDFSSLYMKVMQLVYNMWKNASVIRTTQHDWYRHYEVNVLDI